MAYPAPSTSFVGTPATDLPCRNHPRSRLASQTATTSAPASSELRGHRQQERARPGDDRAAARQRAVRLEQGLHAAGGHDAGQVPAGDRQLPIVAAGAQDQRARAHLAGPFRRLGTGDRHEVQRPGGTRRRFDEPHLRRRVDT